MRVALAVGLAAISFACGGDTRRIELHRVAPQADPGCGAPQDARSLQVTALGDYSADRVVTIGGPLSSTTLELAALPIDTRVLQISVFGDIEARAIGKTAPFDFEELDDGDTLAVAMTPPEGMCATGPPEHARVRPIMARAGDGVLVAGGIDANGAPVAAVERYDPATGTFELVAEALYAPAEDGLIGASATAVPPGNGAGPRVVVAGGPSSGYQIYDATSRRLSAELLLSPSRAHHAALALDADRVLLAGGCELPLDTAQGRCAPSRLHGATTIIDLDEGRARQGPPLLVPRQGGALVRESATTVLYIGGVDGAGAAVTEIERIVLEGEQSNQTFSTGVPAGAVVALHSGAALAGLAPSGSTASAAVVAIPPGSSQAVPVADAPAPRHGATFARLQNGRALLVGGDESGEILLYEAAADRFRPLEAASLDVRDAGVIALDDGSVLIVGGASPGGARPQAWLVRDDLIGPFATGIELSFGPEAIEIAQQWIPSNPARVVVEPARDGDLAHAVITSSGQGGALPSDWAVIAGPELSRATIRARLRASESGGAALMAGFRGPRDYLAIILLPGQEATVFRLSSGELERLECAGQTVAASAISEREDSAAIELSLEDDGLTAMLDGQTIVQCRDLETLPTGLVGIGAVGADGETVRVDSVTVSR